MISGVESCTKVQQDGKRYVTVIDGAVKVVINRHESCVSGVERSFCCQSEQPTCDWLISPVVNPAALLQSEYGSE